MSEHPLGHTRRSQPGFRFSPRDAAVIGVFTLATAWLWGWVGSLSLLLFGVLIHFFLFCNVFRVRTRYELIWASSFVLNAGAWQLADALSWQRLLGSQIVVTALVIGAELRSPSYYGIGHRWIHSRTAPSEPDRGARVSDSGPAFVVRGGVARDPGRRTSSWMLF